jgi:hypothetical protein
MVPQPLMLSSRNSEPKELYLLRLRHAYTSYVYPRAMRAFPVKFVVPNIEEITEETMKLSFVKNAMP